MPTRLLIVDDEEAICFAFARYFEERGFAVQVAASGRDALNRYRASSADVVFLDVRLADMSGLDVLDQLRAIDPRACVIVMTAYGSLDTVTRAVRGKAFDYLVKPLDLDRAAELVTQAVASRAAVSTADAAPPPVAAASAWQLVGASAAMQDVYKRIGLVAQSEAAVLIRGQTGTGKELVARAIHVHSGRSAGRFVPVNCAALPDHLIESELFGYVRGAFTGADADKPGRFELADHGTLFLDEIGELPPAAQVKLLRFLDEQVVERLGSVHPLRLDVRILAATNRDLARAIDEGRFRADLFYRLAVIQIELPPLSDRIDDVVPLAQHFLAQRFGTQAPPITSQAADLLRRFSWPGNVRELRNAVEHAAVVSGGGPVLPAHLPEAVRASFVAASSSDSPEQALAAYLDAICAAATERLHAAAIDPVERALIARVLARCNGNQTAAAESLGLHRNTLRTKLRELGLSEDAS